MMRSPLFYPMHRGDSEAGGAADLQTDIMRFMAILALCLLAIFALVQSIPLIPEAPAQSTAAAAPPPLPVPVPEPIEDETIVTPTPPPEVEEVERPVVLKRPKWTSTFVPQQRSLSRQVIQAPQAEERPEPIQAASAPPPPPTPSPQPTTATKPTPLEVPSSSPPRSSAAQDRGFTLRFESDLALTRLVAAGQVGFFAMGDGRARRMTVSDSRISFWDASTPNAFHEMETSTVPRAVIDALSRSGVNTASIDWGVTLPGKLRQQLDSLMRDNSGGSLVIGLDGKLRLEAS